MRILRRPMQRRESFLRWVRNQEGRFKATWKREFKVPWRKAGPLILSAVMGLGMKVYGLGVGGQDLFRIEGTRAADPSSSHNEGVWILSAGVRCGQLGLLPRPGLNSEFHFPSPTTSKVDLIPTREIGQRFLELELFGCATLLFLF